MDIITICLTKKELFFLYSHIRGSYMKHMYSHCNCLCLEQCHISYIPCYEKIYDKEKIEKYMKKYIKMKTDFLIKDQ